MDPTKMRLLRAASEAAGGIGELAEALGISQAMLRKYMSGAFPLPDVLFLRAVDFLLEDREPHLTLVPPGAMLPASDPREGA